MSERLERKDTFEEKTEVPVARLLSFSFNKGGTFEDRRT